MSDQTSVTKEKPKSFFAANWFKLFFVALAVILLMIYFNRESSLDACIEQARLGYLEDWNFQCKQAKKEPDCSLPRFTSIHIEEAREKMVSQCISRYSFK
jgi:hypothetical protein